MGGAPQKLADLLARPGTALALHFGVSKQAEGFQIELVGRNACRAVGRRRGQLPANEPDRAGPGLAGPRTLPAERIVARLPQLGMPVRTSTDAGGYLCNALLYHSLAPRACRRSPTSSASCISPPTPGTPTARHPPRLPLDWRGAIAGGVEIIAACLESLVLRRR